MKIAKYINCYASVMLFEKPFVDWPTERSVDNESDPPEVRYVFTKCGISINCDRIDEKINCIFVEADSQHQLVLTDISFLSSRAEMQNIFGVPSKSGNGMTHPILGNFGPWDRFERPKYTIHLEFKYDEDCINKITLMRNDVVPMSSATG